MAVSTEFQVPTARAGSRDPSHFLGVSDRTVGITATIGAAVVSSICSISMSVATDKNVPVNAVCLYLGISGFLFGFVLDVWHYFFSTTDDLAHHLLLLEMWQPKQRNKFFSLPSYAKMFLISSLGSYFVCIFLVLSFKYISDAGDAIAIFDCYVVLIPLFAPCFKYSHDWKHRYFICFALLLASVALIAEPEFLFGSDESSDSTSSTDQAIACMFALLSGICVILVILSNTLLKKIAFLDLMGQSQAHVTDHTFSETTPLVGAEAVSTAESANISNSPVAERTEPSARAGANVTYQNGLHPLEGLNINSGGSRAAAGDLEDLRDLPESSGVVVAPQSSAESGEDANACAATGRNANMEDNDEALIASLKDIRVTKQSSEYIVENDVMFIIIYMEYSALVMIVMSLILSAIAPVNGTLSDVFDLYNVGTYSKNAWLYIVLTALTNGADRLGFTFGNIKVPFAPFLGILDITDVLFTYVLSYVWLGETPDVLGAIGAVLMMLAVVVASYPFDKHFDVPQSF